MCRREAVEIDGWIIAYARRRYGTATPPAALVAWEILLRSVYNATDDHTDHSRDIPTSRPGLSPVEVSLWGLKPHLWYNERQVNLPIASCALTISVPALHLWPDQYLFKHINFGARRHGGLKSLRMSLQLCTPHPSVRG